MIHPRQDGETYEDDILQYVKVPAFIQRQRKPAPTNSAWINCHVNYGEGP